MSNRPKMGDLLPTAPSGKNSGKNDGKKASGRQPWVTLNVLPELRQRIRVFAAMNDLDMSAATSRLLEEALKKYEK